MAKIWRSICTWFRRRLNVISPSLGPMGLGIERYETDPKTGKDKLVVDEDAPRRAAFLLDRALILGEEDTEKIAQSLLEQYGGPSVTAEYIPSIKIPTDAKEIWQEKLGVLTLFRGSGSDFYIRIFSGYGFNASLPLPMMESEIRELYLSLKKIFEKGEDNG